ncbi:PatA/PatG family cyanobactin maturation protease [Duganella caerulea]|uniref:PatA/PatG family cyanobactin maturation protease n=1 Tax=Duganella caerulea TaxID=2885762 RepID=UPI004037766B
MNTHVINGLAELWKDSKGSPDIRIAVLDGVPDLSHPSLRSADIKSITTGAAGAVGGATTNHATHIFSKIFGEGDGDGGIQGWAPGCKGISIPIFSAGPSNRVSQRDLVNALRIAIDHEVQVINISGGQLVAANNEADTSLRDIVQECHDKNILVVAAAGNNGCECRHIPASLPHVLAVGAMDSNGQPMDFSNWGNEYLTQGILAPGQEILGAQANGASARLTGTSFATPLVSAVAALLLSIQRKRGMPASPNQVREALLASASPCDPRWGSDCRRFLAGRLNIQQAYVHLFNGGSAMTHQQTDADTSVPSIVSLTPSGLEPQGSLDTVAAMPAEAPADSAGAVSVAAGATGIVPSGASGIVPSGACGCKPSSSSLVYALGKIGYDFGTEARRDGFTQLMPAGQSPYNPEQLLAYLENREFESSMLIWTLNIDLTPIYAIEPSEPFARDTYGLLVGALEGQVAKPDSDGYVERVSIPGYLTGKTVRLYSGQVVPVISVVPRGLYYWNVNKLIDTAMKAANLTDKDDKLKTGLREFLNRIYYDFRNLGTASSERAMNFAATNAFQAITVFAENLTPDDNGHSRQLAKIAVEKSPFCRLDSDCWDVKLAFFDPENDQRAWRIVRYTIDVSDVMPVTIGDPKAWAATSF